MSENKLVVIHTNLEKLLKTKSAALPKNFNETRFLQNAIAVLQDTKDIQKMEAMSVARTMLKGAFLGLDFFNKECYAIPYGDKLNFQTDYKGEIKLAKKYSLKKITDIYAKLVRVGDTFTEYVDRGKQYVDFKPKPFSNGEIIGVFAVCLYEDGSMLSETITKDEAEHVKEAYAKTDKEGKYSKAWRESPGEMYKKICLRRLCKFIEYDFDNMEQQEAHKDSSDVEFTEEIKYDPIEMPTPVEEKKETPPPTMDDDDMPTGRFIQWSELDEDATKDVLKALRIMYSDNKEKISTHGFDNFGKVLAHFEVKSLTPKDMTVEQYWKIHDFLRG